VIDWWDEDIPAKGSLVVTSFCRPTIHEFLMDTVTRHFVKRRHFSMGIKPNAADVETQREQEIISPLTPRAPSDHQTDGFIF
jgi:hypothetical protein